MSGPRELVAGARLLLEHAERRLADEADQCGGLAADSERRAVQDALSRLEAVPYAPDALPRDSEADALAGLFSAFPELLGDE